MTISATDQQSGIDHFEVAEGNYPAVRTGGTYVLVDQSETTPLLVTAYDKAGNKNSILLHPNKTMDPRFWILIGTAVLICGFIFYKRFTVNRKFPFIQKRNAI